MPKEDSGMPKLRELISWSPLTRRQQKKDGPEKERTSKELGDVGREREREQGTLTSCDFLLLNTSEAAEAEESEREELLKRW